MESLFFWVSKIAWAIIAPDMLLVLALLLAAALLWSRWLRLGRWLVTFLALALLTLTFMPLGGWLLEPLQSRFPVNPPLPAVVDGIIVLSGSEDALGSVYRDQVQTGKAAERLHYFHVLARRYPQAKLLFTGGSGSMANQIYREADVARRLLDERGLDVGRVIFERDSRNTIESVRYSRDIIHPGAGENWVVITTAWHMPRTVGIFCEQGWSVIPYPVDYATTPAEGLGFDADFSGNLGNLITATREWLGLAAYFLTGKTDTLLPEGC